ncbi:MAG TPA: M28 family peptidase [Thermoanaerobaculia bacterium]|nr:M28 family peptidase [Thermoanaerobaculia bacterium]
MRLTGIVVVALLLIVLAVAAWAVSRRRSGERPAGEARAQPARLEVSVRTLVESFGPRDEGHPENLDRAATWIRGELERAGGKVSDQPFQIGGATYRNVSAFFGPDTRDRIVVGAHYDTAGPLPGADDNASGVAGVLELARLLGSSPLKRRVELVAYPLEEPPYFASAQMGSAFHARALKEQGVQVRSMICLEMIGYFSDAPDSQEFPVSALRLTYPTRGNFILIVGRLGQGGVVRRVRNRMQRAAAPLDVRSLVAPASIPGVDFSDHRNYWNEGWDAVMITDSAFYRNPNYHDERDTPDTLDYQRMARVVDGVLAAVVAEAG